YLLAAQSATVIGAARWYLMVVPVVALLGLPFYPMRGRGDFSAWNALRITPAATWLVILVVAWLVGCHSPTTLAYTYLIGLSLLFFPVAFVTRRRIPGSFAPQRQQFEPLLRYGLPCMLTTFPQTLNLRLDQMLMAGLLPPIDLGLYVAAVAWSGALFPLLNALGWALFPKVAGEPNEERRMRSFVQGSRLGSLLAAATGLLLMVVTPGAMILLFGS